MALLEFYSSSAKAECDVQNNACFGENAGHKLSPSRQCQMGIGYNISSTAYTASRSGRML